MARLTQLCLVSTHPSGAELVCYISLTNVGSPQWGLCWTEQHQHVSSAAGGFKRESAIKADAVVFDEWLQISTASGDDLFSL